MPVPEFLDGPNGNKLGAKNEVIVKVALKEFKEQGKIKDFLQRDIRGIDFYVTLIGGKTLPLQVKSSMHGELQHTRKYASIPCIVIDNHFYRLRQRRMTRLVKKAQDNLLRLLNIPTNLLA